MVSTLLILLVLSIIAIGAVWLATSENRITFAESVHVSSVFSADAGSEAGINFLRLSENPPKIIDFAEMTVRNVAETTIRDNQSYEYGCRFIQKSPKPGWAPNFLDYDYRLASTGKASADGKAGVVLVSSRLFRDGY